MNKSQIEAFCDAVIAINRYRTLFLLPYFYYRRRHLACTGPPYRAKNQYVEGQRKETASRFSSKNQPFPFYSTPKGMESCPVFLSKTNNTVDFPRNFAEEQRN